MRRVVITGIGVVSPHGLGGEAFWAGLQAGQSSIRAMSRFDASGFPSRIAGEVPDFRTADYVPKSYRKSTKIMARDIELAVVAADHAVRDAKLATRGTIEMLGAEKTAGWLAPDPARVGCNIGAGLICADLNELTGAMAQARGENNTLDLAAWGKSPDANKPSGMDNLTPLWLLKYLPNMLACHITIIHDTQGPSNAITCGQSSAGLALSEAYRTIQRGSADLALAGGCESALHPMGVVRWSLLNRLTTAGNDAPATACRPMDTAASGTVIAEGGAVFLLEEYEHAKRRGATIYAEIAGVGASANATAIGQPDSSGQALAAAMSAALRDAKMTADTLDVICPSGYGDPAWDAADAAALTKLQASQAQVWPVRGGLGDCGAGAQALDLAALALALKNQYLPPTVNCDKPIAGLKVASTGQARPLAVGLSVMGGIGGQNAALVLKRFSE